MKKILLLSLMMFSMGFKVCASEHAEGIPAEEALKKLMDGNQRFVEMKQQHPDESIERRKEMREGQHPFAAILSCSDSRVPLELIFDQGFGDLFEIKNAGNVLDEHVIGSIEYAVMHTGVKLVVIMGHQDCGAVAATLSGKYDTKFIKSLEDSIKPAIKKCKADNLEVNSDNVVREHVMQDIEELMSKDTELVKYMKEHRVMLVPAYYSIETGKVEFMRRQGGCGCGVKPSKVEKFNKGCGCPRIFRCKK